MFLYYRGTTPHFSRKFKDKTEYLEEFLRKVTFELVDTPSVIDLTKYPDIRDKRDLPILVSAITKEVDIFITCFLQTPALSIPARGTCPGQTFLLPFCCGSTRYSTRRRPETANDTGQSGGFPGCPGWRCNNRPARFSRRKEWRG